MAQNKMKYEVVFTPKGSFIFPRLNTPDTKFKAEGEYSVKIKLSAEEGEKMIEKLMPIADQAFEDAKGELKEAIKEAKGAKLVAAKAALAKLEKGTLPVRPTYNDDGTEDGGYEMAFKMAAQYTDKKKDTVVKRKPAIIDAAGKNLENPPEIWGGTIGKVKGFIKPYYNPSSNNAGVSLRLMAVQIIELVSKGNGGDQGFGKEEGGYVGEDLPKQREASEEAEAPAGAAPGGEDDDF